MCMCVYITSLAGMINEAAIADYQFKKALARGGRPSLMETCVVHARGFTRPEPDVFFRVRYNSGEINRSHSLSLSLSWRAAREKRSCSHAGERLIDSCGKRNYRAPFSPGLRLRWIEFPRLREREVFSERARDPATTTMTQRREQKKRRSCFARCFAFYCPAGVGLTA